jgi:hypothetical protein
MRQAIANTGRDASGLHWGSVSCTPIRHNVVLRWVAWVSRAGPLQDLTGHLRVSLSPSLFVGAHLAQSRLQVGWRELLR